MATSFRPLDIRQRLGKNEWGIPREFGPDGWIFDHRLEHGGIILTNDPDGVFGKPDEWWHCSMSFANRLPTYTEMALLASAVWPDGYAYQVNVPGGVHVNIHENALHWWGRADGANVLPEFGKYGSI